MEAMALAAWVLLVLVAWGLLVLVEVSATTFQEDIGSTARIFISYNFYFDLIKEVRPG